LTVRDALPRAVEFLAAKGIDSPRLDAEHLLGHALGLSRLQLYTEFDRPLTSAEETAARELLVRRGRREPLAYVLGEWGFRRLTLKVDARALVPRPETESLVGRALELVADVEAPRVLDVGVGSGAIALSVKDERPDARVTAVDVSPDALALARENAQRLGLDVELELVEAGFARAADGWDVVIANPPYVHADEIDALQPEVRDWEPRLATVGAGLHEAIARAARTRWLVVEVGDGQAEQVAAAFGAAGYEDVRISPDLGGRDRVVEGRQP
jgi:release factor glutamine methyltransferase